MMKVRLTRKLAEFVDGIDLRSFQVGDVVDLAPAAAHLLIVEGWASATDPARAVASDRPSKAGTPARQHPAGRELASDVKISATPVESVIEGRIADGGDIDGEPSA